MKEHRFVSGLVALWLLVVSGVAGAAIATSEHAYGVATQAELARMEKDQAERTSPWGGGYIPENHGKFVQDGREWEIIDSVTVSVVLNQTGKGDVAAAGLPYCEVEANMSLAEGLAGVKVHHPVCYNGGRVKKVEVRWYKQSLASRNEPAPQAKPTWSDSCLWHCSGEYLVPSHNITKTQRVWATVTWTFVDGQTRTRTLQKWAYNDRLQPFPVVRDTRSAGGPDSYMPFRIPTTGWYNCEDDPTKAPTCARTTDEGFWFDGQGSLLCGTDHDKFHTDYNGKGVWWNNMVPWTNI